MGEKPSIVGTPKLGREAQVDGSQSIHAERTRKRYIEEWAGKCARLRATDATNR